MHPFALDPETELRLFAPEQAEAYLAMIEANRAHIRTYIRTAANIESLEEARERLAEKVTQYNEGRLVSVGIWHQGAIAGELSMFAIDRRDRHAMFGYYLAEAAQGRGLMTRACAAMTTHAFRDLGLHRLEIRCATENVRSRAIPERLGYRLEGILRDAQWLYDRYVDHALYAMIATDWQA